MSIHAYAGTITHISDLSKTAKEVVVTLTDPLACLPGSFVNFFMEIDGTEVRRAYSVVRADEKEKSITLAIRHTLDGTMTPEFWKSNILGRAVRIMGPLGRNTADKLSHASLNLFAYGIGAGVIRSVLDYALEKPSVTKITVTTGSRNEEDIIYREYFDAIVQKHPHVSVKYIVSNPIDSSYPFVGYVQDHIRDVDCSNSDVYMCGQEKACDALTEKIKSIDPENASFFIEAFH